MKELYINSMKQKNVVFIIIFWFTKNQPKKNRKSIGGKKKNLLLNKSTDVILCFLFQC